MVKNLAAVESCYRAIDQKLKKKKSSLLRDWIQREIYKFTRTTIVSFYNQGQKGFQSMETRVTIRK